MEVSELRKGFNNSRVLLAFDNMSLSIAQENALELGGHAAGGKVNNLIDRHGIDALGSVRNAGLRFYDPKIKDIEQTVRNRLLEYKTHADIVTVHGDMKSATLSTAAKTAEICGFACVAVTILTDMTDDDCRELYGYSAAEMVQRLTVRARDAGVHGIVCSPKEVKMVRQEFPEGLIITPGIRLAGSDHHDQARVGTPEQAIRDGADLLVIGRDILAEDTRAGRLNKLGRYNIAINDALFGLF